MNIFWLDYNLPALLQEKIDSVTRDIEEVAEKAKVETEEQEKAMIEFNQKKEKLDATRRKLECLHANVQFEQKKIQDLNEEVSC